MFFVGFVSGAYGYVGIKCDLVGIPTTYRVNTRVNTPSSSGRVFSVVIQPLKKEILAD